MIFLGLYDVYDVIFEVAIYTYTYIHYTYIHIHIYIYIYIYKIFARE